MEAEELRRSRTVTGRHGDASSATGILGRRTQRWTLAEDHRREDRVRSYLGPYRTPEGLATEALASGSAHKTRRSLASCRQISRAT